MRFLWPFVWRKTYEEVAAARKTIQSTAIKLKTAWDEQAIKVIHLCWPFVWRSEYEAVKCDAERLQSVIQDWQLIAVEQKNKRIAAEEERDVLRRAIEANDVAYQEMVDKVLAAIGLSDEEKVED